MRLPDIDYSKRAVMPYQGASTLERNVRIADNFVKDYVQVKDAEDDLAAEQAAMELIGVDKQLSAHLQNMDTVSLDENPFSKNANEMMRNQLSEEDKASGLVPTEKVIATAYDASMRDAYETITEGMNEKQKKKVQMRILPQYSQSVADLTKHKINLEVGRLKFKYQNAYDTYVRGGEVLAAEDLAQQALQSGAWTPEYYYKQQENARQQYIAGRYMEELSSAKTVDDVLGLKQGLLGTAQYFGADLTRQLATDSDNAISSIVKAEDQRYKIGERIITNKFIEGTLVKEDLTAATNAGDAKSDFAIMMSKNLDTQSDKPVKTPQDVIDAWERQIADINNTVGGEQTVKQKAAYLRTMLGMATSGLNEKAPNEPVKKAVMTGEDAERLAKLIDTVEQRTLRPNGYDDAVRMIRNNTRTTEATYGASGGNKQNTDAFQDYYNGLIQYINFEGMKADPVEWVNKNKQKYEVSIYEAEKDDQFISQFPQYSAPEFVTSVTVTGASGRVAQERKLSTDKVKAKMINDYRATKISKWELDQQWYLLDGKYSGESLDDMMMNEDVESFHNNIDDINRGSGNAQ